MARQYVFLVHGMGEMDPNKWHEPFTTAIISALKQYEPFVDKPPADIKAEDLKLIPITYDDVFSAYRDRWEDLSVDVADAVAAISPGIGKVFDELSESVNEVDGWKKFFWTHVLDPLLWYFFEDARMAVVARVNEQFITGLNDMINDENAGSAHVLAHSLGTSVTHDSLVALRHWSSAEGQFEPDKHVWHTVGMIANVGRLLEATFTLRQGVAASAFRVYKSALKPGVAGRLNALWIMYWPTRLTGKNMPTTSPTG